MNSVNCLNISNLIVLSHSLQGVRELGQLFEYPSSEHPIPSLRPQEVCELGQLEKIFEYLQLIILSHPLQPVRGLDQLS